MQSQQLPTESQVLEDEVLPGAESADQPTEEMSERHDHGKNFTGKIRIQLFAKSFILQVYDVLARHKSANQTKPGLQNIAGIERHVAGLCKAALTENFSFSMSRAPSEPERRALF